MLTFVVVSVCVAICVCLNFSISTLSGSQISKRTVRSVSLVGKRLPLKVVFTQHSSTWHKQGVVFGANKVLFTIEHSSTRPMWFILKNQITSMQQIGEYLGVK